MQGAQRARAERDHVPPIFGFKGRLHVRVLDAPAQSRDLHQLCTTGSVVLLRECEERTGGT